jgi:cobalt-zinc-cadmium efflux system membrane fusion protein
MAFTELRPTVLVVDDDEVLRRVLRRVLAQAGYEVLLAASVEEALQPSARTPQLGLLDLSLPDGNGVELARTLHARMPGLPLVLMTAYPNRVQEQPEAASQFLRVLTKPMNLDELRQIVAAALTSSSMAHAAPPELAAPPVGACVVPARDPAAGAAVPDSRRVGGAFFRAVRSAGLLVLVGIVLVIFLGFVLGVQVPGFASHPDSNAGMGRPRQAGRVLEGVRVVEDGDRPHTLQVPQEVREVLGIRKGGKEHVEVIKAPTQMRPLTLYGSTALDPTRLVRIRARFAPAEVVQIGQHALLPGETGNTSGQTEFRELRPGDRVAKGDVLGVFFSVDVGSKKNDLLDALVQLQLDQQILDQAEKHSAALPEVFVLTQRRLVQGDRNAINRALNNLKVWNIPQDEIDALHAEARKIAADKDGWFQTPEGRWFKGEKQGAPGKVDPDSENENPWGKVTLRAPFDGIIVERNITLHEIVQDPTTNLFQLASVKRLLVIANSPEDELPTLNALKHQERVWSVRTVGAAAITGLKGPIEEVGYLIDPNQHTAVIKGYIDNPGEQIRAGQFVSCTVQLPPPPDVVEVPVDAVVEDGKYCIVFVQTDPVKHCYQMRRVQITHRFEKTVFVRSKPFAKDEQLSAEEKELGLLPREPLRPGERLLTTGVGELKAALLDLESRPGKDNEGK